MESRTSKEHGSILISGTGRASTTLLVQYFTALGFDTGLTPEQARITDPVSRAGLETNPRGRLPYVSKSPWYSDLLMNRIEKGQLKAKYCIVPMRDLFAAAESRRRVFNEVRHIEGAKPVRYPGGLWKTVDPDKQEEKLAVQFHKLVYALVAHQVPVYFLHFPKLAESPDYLFQSLRSLLERHGVTAEESARAHQAVVDTSLIHRFEQAQSEDRVAWSDPNPARRSGQI